MQSASLRRRAVLVHSHRARLALWVMWMALSPCLWAASADWALPGTNGSFTANASWTGGVVPTYPGFATLAASNASYTASLAGAGARLAGLIIGDNASMNLGAGGNLTLAATLDFGMQVLGGSLVVGTGSRFFEDGDGAQFTVADGGIVSIDPTASWTLRNPYLNLSGAQLIASNSNPFAIFRGNINTPSGPFSNSGTVFVRASSLLASEALRVNATLSDAGLGTPRLSSILQFVIPTETTVTLDGKRGQTPSLVSGTSGTQPFLHYGLLQGDGRVVTPDFLNAGVVRPGGLNQAGSLLFSGNYATLDTPALGKVEFELGGIIAGESYDRIQLGAGSASFAFNNSAVVTLINGFNPQAGEQFRIVDAPLPNTNLATPALPTLGANLSWDLSQSNEGILRVVSGDALRSFTYHSPVTGNFLTPGGYVEGHLTAPGTLRNDVVSIAVDGGGTPYTVSAGTPGGRLTELILKGLSLAAADANVALNADQIVIPTITITSGNLILDSSNFRSQSFTVNITSGATAGVTDHGTSRLNFTSSNASSVETRGEAFLISSNSVLCTVSYPSQQTEVSLDTTVSSVVSGNFAQGTFSVSAPDLRVSNATRVQSFTLTNSNAALTANGSTTASHGSIATSGNRQFTISFISGCFSQQLDSFSAEGLNAESRMRFGGFLNHIVAQRNAHASGVEASPLDTTTIREAVVGSEGSLKITNLNFTTLDFGEGLYDDIAFGQFGPGGFSTSGGNLTEASFSPSQTVTVRLNFGGKISVGQLNGGGPVGDASIVGRLALQSANAPELSLIDARDVTLADAGDGLTSELTGNSASVEQITGSGINRLSIKLNFTRTNDSISLSDGFLLDLAPPTPDATATLEVRNQIQVASGARFTIGRGAGVVTGSLIVAGNGSRISVDGTVTTETFSSGVSISNGARLEGSGTVFAPGAFGLGGILVSGDGIVAPGNSPGNLTLVGDTTFEFGSLLDMELGGLAPGTEYDRLIVDGNLTITGGNLSFTLIDGFVPVGPAEFDVLDVTGNLTGAFENLLLPTLDGELAWDTSDIYTSGTLRVIPEVSTPMLLALGVLFPMLRRRRRRP